MYDALVAIGMSIITHDDNLNYLQLRLSFSFIQHYDNMIVPSKIYSQIPDESNGIPAPTVLELPRKLKLKNREEVDKLFSDHLPVVAYFPMRRFIRDAPQEAEV